MFHTIREYPLVKVDGCAYRPMAYGDPQPDGTWNGWLAFFPVDSGTEVKWALETTECNFDALTAWAAGLDDVDLEGALFFALRIEQQPPKNAGANRRLFAPRERIQKRDLFTRKWQQLRLKGQSRRP